MTDTGRFAGEQQVRGTRGRFQRGESGNPAGRARGSKNRATLEREAANELRRAIASSGDLTPLRFLLGLLGDDEAPLEARLKAAALALPYVHVTAAAREPTLSESISRLLD